MPPHPAWPHSRWPPAAAGLKPQAQSPSPQAQSSAGSQISGAISIVAGTVKRRVPNLRHNLHRCRPSQALDSLLQGCPSKEGGSVLRRPVSRRRSERLCLRLCMIDCSVPSAQELAGRHTARYQASRRHQSRPARSDICPLAPAIALLEMLCIVTPGCDYVNHNTISGLRHHS